MLPCSREERFFYLAEDIPSVGSSQQWTDARMTNQATAFLSLAGCFLSRLSRPDAAEAIRLFTNAIDVLGRFDTDRVLDDPFPFL